MLRTISLRMAVTWDQLELPWDEVAPVVTGSMDAAPATPRSVFSTFAECPLCGGDLVAEHAHFRCPACGWRDSCCD